MSLVLGGVTFTYAGAAGPALRHLDLTCDAGTITWLAGAPGAGTSTVLLAAAGLAPQHTGGTMRGRCRLLGHDPQADAGRQALRGRVAFVTADPASQLSGIAVTVEGEVAFAPANLGRPRSEILDHARRAMARCGVAHLASRLPASLSGGEQQRVVLASMAALTPDVWLLDDPGSALDAEGRAMLASLLRSEAARGALVLVASEDADWLIGWSDRLVVLQHGSVVRDGVPHALLSDPGLVETGAPSTAIATLAMAVQRRAPGSVPGRLPVSVEEGLARWS